MVKTVSILGCGYLGFPLAQRLLAAGYAVKGATTTPAKLSVLERAGIEPYLVMLSPEWKGDAAEGFLQSDILFLNIPPQRTRPDVEAYYDGMLQSVLHALGSAPTRLVVFASSTSVYAATGGTVTEQDAGNPMPETASGCAVLKAEQSLQVRHSFDTTVLRFGGLYGYDRAPGRFVRGVVKNPEAPVNLVHRDDAVAAAFAVIDSDCRGEVFNVCTDGHPTRGVFYKQAAEWLGLDPPPVAGAGSSPGKRVDSSWLKTCLGYAFRHVDPLVQAP